MVPGTIRVSTSPSGPEQQRDGSSRPHHSPGATKTEIVGKIVYLRQHYHFGPRKISVYLHPYHEIEISPSGVWRSSSASI